MSIDRYRTVVRRRHVRSREIKVVVALLVSSLALGLGFYLGQKIAYSELDIDPKVYREMAAELPVLAERFVQASQELDMSRTRNEVDRNSLELVRREMALQKERIRELEESQRFYRNLMSPEDVAGGLTLLPIELIATDYENRFAYRIVAQQEARKHSLLKGSLSVAVVGVGEDGEMSLPLSSLSESVEKETIALRFRYFQAIEGELVLPPGFTPRAVAMVAQSSTPKKVEIREHFPWSVQERFIYVGK